VILSRTSIIKEIENGNLKFDPRIKNDQVGPSSIDLRLGNTFIHLDKELQEEQSVGADVR
jgi:deoxycytidine triphosphate deaminase